MQRSLRLASGPLAQVSASTKPASRAYSSFYPRASTSSSLPTRPFHTTQTLNATTRDRQTIDFAYMPQFEFAAPASNEIARIPLLPTNFDKPRDDVHFHEAIEPVSRPIIRTVSADSTHIHSPSAMTDVTDNHSVDIDVFNLPSQVAYAANKLRSTASRVEESSSNGNSINEFLTGFMGDVFGARRLAHA